VRDCHVSSVNALALLDIEPVWIYPDEKFSENFNRKVQAGMIKLIRLFAGKGGSYAVVVIALMVCGIWIFKAGKDIERANGKVMFTEYQYQIVVNLHNDLAKEHKKLNDSLSALQNRLDEMTNSYLYVKIELDTLLPMYQTLYKRYYGTDHNQRRFTAAIQEKYKLNTTFFHN
jgi:hypothetical protein